MRHITFFAISLLGITAQACSQLPKNSSADEQHRDSPRQQSLATPDGRLLKDGVSRADSLLLLGPSLSPPSLDSIEKAERAEWEALLRADSLAVPPPVEPCGADKLLNKPLLRTDSTQNTADRVSRPDSITQMNRLETAENFYSLTRHIATRTYALLPQMTVAEQKEILTWPMWMFRLNRAWTDSTMRGLVRPGPVYLSPESKAWYENCVMERLTTEKTLRAARRLPRPWPIWSPPFIWGAPRPRMPDWPKEETFDLSNDVIHHDFDSSGYIVRKPKTSPRR